MKIKSLSFQSYKAFEDIQTIVIKPITVIIGKNSSGKSSIAKLFTLLENSLSGDIKEPLLIKNHDVELGSEFRDLVYNRQPNIPISFKIKFENGADLEVKIVQELHSPTLTILEWTYIKENYEIKITKDKNSNDINMYRDEPGNQYKCIFRGFIPKSIVKIPSQEDITPFKIIDYKIDVDYIGPFRILPKRQFLLTGQLKYVDTGSKGENAYLMLGISKLLGNDLHIQVGDWFEKNFDGWRLEVENKNNKPFWEINLSKNDTDVNIVDVGQGMNQVLPLVVRSFVKRKNSLVIVEQPELHLHPAAHGDVAELFVKSAKDYDQNFLIETHSENFLLRFRKLVVEKKYRFNFEDIIIYYVGEDEGRGQRVEEITLDEYGTLSNWPEGVFAENIEEIMEIKAAIAKKKIKKVENNDS